MSLSNTLKARWRPEFDKHGVALAARKQFHSALDVYDTIEAKRAELSRDIRLSDIGRTQKLKEFAASEAKRVARAQRTLAAARAQLADQRMALVPAVANKTDVVGAMLRQEQRAYLRSLKPAEMVAVLTDKSTPAIVLESIFEAPNLITNIPPEIKDRLVGNLIERLAPAAVAAIAEQNEVLDLLSAAVRASSETLRSAAGVAQGAFDAWLTEVAPVSEQETKAEADAFGVEAIKQSAAGLPLKTRISLVDSLLATNTAEIKAA